MSEGICTIWRLERDYDSRREHSITPPTGSDGKMIDFYSHGVVHGELRCPGAKPLPDAWITAKTLLVNEVVRRMLEQHRLPPCTRFVPLSVYRGDLQFEAMYAVMEGDRYRVLDLVRSPHTCYPSTNVLWKVERWILDGSRLPGAKLFQADRSEWFAAQALKDDFEKHGVVGLKFAPCEVILDVSGKSAANG